MRRPLYVEFVGIAGAGKTTVWKEVIAELNALNYRCVWQGLMGFQVIHPENHMTARTGRGWRARNKLDRLLSFALLHLRHLRVSTGLFRYAYSTGQLVSKLRVLRTLPLLCQRIQNACATVSAGYGDLIVFDQGVVHSLRKMVVPGCRAAEARMTGVLRTITEVVSPVRVVFVLFTLDADAAVKRIQPRPVALGRFDRLSPEHARQELAVQAPCSEHIVELFSRTGAVDGVLRVDAARAPAEIADLITGFIMSDLEPTQVAPARLPELS